VSRAGAIAWRALADTARLAVAAVAGALLALALFNIWDLELRWLVIVIVGVLGLAAAMSLVRVFSDFVTVVCLFVLSLASFTKWFWPLRYSEDERGNLVYGGLLGIGLLDFILVGLYLSWFYRVCVLRDRPAPGMLGSDWFVIGYIGAHLLSSMGADDPELAFGATEYLVKYALLYFYLSRNLKPRHMAWLLAAFAFAILGEATLGIVQYATGKLLGIALDKGAGGSAVDYQYSVPGIESLTRATGTCYDSHSLGNFMGMLLPFPLVLCFTPRVPVPARLIFAVFALLAAIVIVLTLSRAAWVSTALSLGLGLALMTGVWREREVIPLLIGIAMAVLAALPLTASFIYSRFAESPYEVLTTRFDQYTVALQVVREYPLFGFGPGNWINALAKHDFLWLEVLPPHNVALWVLAETGILGLVFYLAIVVSAAARLLRLIANRRDLSGRLGMATLIALATTVLVGLTDPTYREPNVFAVFWLLIALSVALPRLPYLSANAFLAGRRAASPRPSLTIASPKEI
jgi:hypothetical protein